MTLITLTYAIYLLLSLAITVWVANTLSHHGRVFLIDVFHGNITRADATNRLLVVGFYLLNIAGVLFNLRADHAVTDGTASLNFLTTRIGCVLTVLGVMHFFNLIVLTTVRRFVVDPQASASECV